MYAVYLARSEASEGTVRYARGTPGHFQISEVVQVSDFSIGGGGARDLATLDLDAGGDPVVAVQDRSQLLVLRVTDGGLETLGDFRAASGVEFKQQTDLVIDDDGRVHVVWWETGGVPGTVCHGASG